MTNLTSHPVLVSKCHRCPTGAGDICCALSDEQARDLSKLMRECHFDAGNPIVHQDDISELFAIVQSGVVKLSRMLPDGRQQIVSFLTEGDCLGDLFRAETHDTAECVTNVSLCCFPRKRFEALLKKHPEIQHRLFLRAMNDLDATRDWLFALGRKKAPEKVAMFLLWLSRKWGPQPLDPDDPTSDLTIHCPFSRQEIAEFIGLTLETVSRQLSKLRRAGVIALHRDRCIEIIDPEALERLSDGGS